MEGYTNLRLVINALYLLKFTQSLDVVDIIKIMHSEKLYHHCFYCDEVAENDLFPVGGGFIGSTDMPWKVQADFGNIFPKFEPIAKKHLDCYQGEGWQHWFTKTAPDMDPALMAILQSFTSAFEGKRKLQSTNATERRALYDQGLSNTVKLSEILALNSAMCVEISLLAKKFLDTQGISSRVYSGEMLSQFTQGDIHFPEAHTFLVIGHAGKEYIFDPANPNKASDGRDLLALSKPCRSLLHGDDLRCDSLLVKTEDIISKRVFYYGVGDLGNIPEQCIVHESPTTRPNLAKVKTSAEYIP